MINNFFTNYLTDNLIKFITFLGLLVGGVSFLAYYYYIEYFPSLGNLTDLTYMFFAMALIGAFLLVFLAFIFILPAILYDYTFDKEIKSYIGISTFIFSIALFPLIVMIFFILLKVYTSLATNVLYLFLLYVCVLIIYLGVVGVMYYRGNKRFGGILFSIAFLTLIGFMPILVYAIFLQSGQSNIVTYADALIVYIIFEVLAVVTNGLLVHANFKKKFQDKLFVQVIIGLFVVLIVMFALRVYAIVPSVVMHYLRLGNFTIEKIYSKHRSCSVLSDLNSSDFKIISFEDYCKVEALEKNQTICILSNIGKRMLLKVSVEDTQKSKKLLIELPKEDFFGMEFNHASKGCVGNKMN